MENPSGKLLEMDDNLGYPVPTWLRRDLHMVSLEIPAPGVNICRTDDWTTNVLNPLVLVNLKTELSSSSNQTAHSIPAFWNQRIEEVGYPSCHQHLVVFLLISWGYCKKIPSFCGEKTAPIPIIPVTSGTSPVLHQDLPENIKNRLQQIEEKQILK